MSEPTDDTAEAQRLITEGLSGVLERAAACWNAFLDAAEAWRRGDTDESAKRLACYVASTDSSKAQACHELCTAGALIVADLVAGEVLEPQPLCEVGTWKTIAMRAINAATDQDLDAFSNAVRFAYEDSGDDGLGCLTTALIDLYRQVCVLTGRDA